VRYRDYTATVRSTHSRSFLELLLFVACYVMSSSTISAQRVVQVDSLTIKIHDEHKYAPEFIRGLIEDGNSYQAAKIELMDSLFIVHGQYGIDTARFPRMPKIGRPVVPSEYL